jgi:2,3-bisphosphoglycerate-dependent phosphoglycerate mutase
MRRTLFLARHGRTGWNEAGRYLGRSDVDLDEVGEAQAEALARWAAASGVGALVTSPARRAVRTAAAVAGTTGLPARTDDRLRELDFGAAEGRTLAEMRAADPGLVARFEADPATHHFPGGEDPAAAALRVARAVEDALAGAAAPVLVVTHSTVLRLFVCRAIGLPLGEYRRRLPFVEHGAVTELAVTDGGYALRRFNAAPPGGGELRHGTGRPAAVAGGDAAEGNR